MVGRVMRLEAAQADDAEECRLQLSPVSSPVVLLARLAVLAVRVVNRGE